MSWEGRQKGGMFWCGYSPWRAPGYTLLILITTLEGAVNGGAGAVAGSPAEAPAAGGDDEGGGDWTPPAAWYGNIQYLINISIIGALCCLLLFLAVKLRSDHRLPGPSSLIAKLLAVWHTTAQQIGRHCGANASQYLAVQGYSFVGFFAIALIATLLLLPLNIYGGTVTLQDQFLKSTVIHVKKGSLLLWGHLLFMVAAVGTIHLCIRALEQRLVCTLSHDGESADSVSAFTLMIRGIPRSLAIDKRPLEDYFEHSYPGKVFRVIIPPDLSTFHGLGQKLVKKKQQISWLQAQKEIKLHTIEDAQFSLDHREIRDGNTYVDLSGERRNGFHGLKQKIYYLATKVHASWQWLLDHLGFVLDDKIRRLLLECAELESKLQPYKEGRAFGAGIAFVIFKDLYAASRALQDARNQSNRSAALTELQLGRSRWSIERAPPARDIYWHHLGSSTISRYCRRVAVNALLLLLLLFCSSPLAAFTALHSAGRLINPEAMENFNLWLAWVQSSSWAAAVTLQFLPNLLIFVSMYLLVPAALSYLSSFESHLTVSGEQRAALVKTVCFFLVNLILLRGLLETTLEATLLRMGRCYVEGEECKDIEQYMSSSFLANSCLSATAFLITSSFLGVSYDLLAPIPWIKRYFQQSRRESAPDYTAEEPSSNYATIEEESLHEELLPNGNFNFPGVEPVIHRVESLSALEMQGQDLSVYPLVTGMSWHVQTFDYAQYYAFNLTVFALVLIYSAFVPVIVPIGALYFGYRYIVDKYNFLFVYRVRGFPSSNDGKLLGTVLRIMRVCIVFYLVVMLFFFSVRGDREKLQFMSTLAILIFICTKYGIEKLVSFSKDGFDLSAVQIVGSIDNIVDGPVEYEVFSRPNFEWVPSDVI